MRLGRERGKGGRANREQSQDLQDEWVKSEAATPIGEGQAEDGQSRGRTDGARARVGWRG